MAFGLAAALRNDLAQAVADAIDDGGAAAELFLYNGSRPATGGTATTLLATFTLDYPCAGAPSGGVLTLSGMPITAVAVAASTATWFRIKTSAGTFVLDGSVTATGGGGDFEIDTTTIGVGDTVTITSAVITAPAP
jgi:hypothetical protein